MGRNNAVDFWNSTFISFPMMAAFPWNWSRSQDKHVICGQTAHPPSRQHQSVHNNDAQNLTQTRSHTGLLAISLNVLANFVSPLCRGGTPPAHRVQGLEHVVPTWWEALHLPAAPVAALPPVPEVPPAPVKLGQKLELDTAYPLYFQILSRAEENN